MVAAASGGRGENLFRGYNPIIKSIGCDVDEESAADKVGQRIRRADSPRKGGRGGAN